MPRCRVLAFTALALVGGLALAAPEPLSFDKDVRPILSENCFACHGPDAGKRMASLRLDEPNPAVVPGDVLGSELARRIMTEGPALMPPTSSHKSLSAAQKKILLRWIDSGAKYEKHWSFQPLAVSTVGSGGSIDSHIRTRLQAEGLTPAPRADKRTLARRVALDLTGLPLPPARVEAFVSDSSPKAYENLVDELLASPHYGERMALPWLDLARYADTHGYHIDSHRDMYRWRDWVIEALNKNMPYDQFVTEQLAGDLLPNPTRAQQIATGFNRNHPINFEGGAIPEEYAVAYVADRVDTTASAFLGLTMRCAQCHDHKYEPISQTDYYRFFAYFNNIDENGLDGQTGNAKPFIKAPYPEQEARLKEIDARLPALNDTLTQREKALPGEKLAEWLTGNLARWDEALKPGLTWKKTFSGEPGYVSGATKFEGKNFIDEPGKGEVERDSQFSYGVWFWRDGSSNQALFAKMDAKLGVRGWDLFIDASGKPMAHLIHNWPDNAIRVDGQESIPEKTWTHVFVTYDGSSKAVGVKLYVDGKPVRATNGADSLTGTIKTDTPLRFGGRYGTDTTFKGQLDDARFYTRTLKPEEVAQLAEADTLRNAISSNDAARRTKLVRRVLSDTDASYKTTLTERDALSTEHMTIERETPTTMVMSELTEKPRVTHRLDRGQYDLPKEAVTPGIPGALGLPAPKGKADRLQLARWLTNPKNPLTARVEVNRIWQHFFGNGLVRTSENLGYQGERPSHPELLDALSQQFISSGWNIKAMVKAIVLSETYCQSAKPSAEAHKKDPENRLLSYAPRLRLPAELVRDLALASSGLMVEKIGGPSVKPYQPAGLWDEMAFGGNFTAQTYEQDHGEKLYRRSLYTFWKRTVPPPSLQTFDAPEREFCLLRRPTTNTPLQALVLMNDPTYAEASRKLAERMLKESAPATGARIARAFALVLSRPPSTQETKKLTEIYNSEFSRYLRNPALVDKRLTVGEAPTDSTLNRTELAAWASVASLIINLDEAITRG